MRQAILSVVVLVLVPVLSAQDQGPFYIPVAGELRAAGLTYTTEIRIDNRRSVGQRVRIAWLGQDGLRSRENALTLDLGPNESRAISAAALLDNSQGLGAAKITPIDASGATDASAIIETSAAISAFRPDGSALTQDVVSIPYRDARGGLETGSDPTITFFPVPMRGMLPVVLNRTNYGIVNEADDAGVFTIQIRFPGFAAAVYEESVTVPPRAMVQRPLRSDFSSPVDDSRAIVTVRRSAPTAGRWLAYVSSINIPSGDARLIRPLPPFGRQTETD